MNVLQDENGQPLPYVHVSSLLKKHVEEGKPVDLGEIRVFSANMGGKRDVFAYFITTQELQERGFKHLDTRTVNHTIRDERDGQLFLGGMRLVPTDDFVRYMEGLAPHWREAFGIGR